MFTKQNTCLDRVQRDGGHPYSTVWKFTTVLIIFLGLSQANVLAQPLIIPLQRTGAIDDWDVHIMNFEVFSFAGNRDEDDSDYDAFQFGAPTSITKDLGTSASVSNADAYNDAEFNSFGSLASGQVQTLPSITQQSDFFGEAFAGTYLPNDPTLANARTFIRGYSFSEMTYKPKPKFPNHFLNHYTIKVGYTLEIEDAWGTQYISPGVICKGSAHRVGGALLSFFQIRHLGNGVFVLEGMRYLNDRDDVFFVVPEIEFFEDIPVPVGVPKTYTARNVLKLNEQVRVRTMVTPFSTAAGPKIMSIAMATATVDLEGNQIILVGDDEAGLKARVTLDIQLEDWLH